MKTEKTYSWVLRILNPSTGEVEYRTRMCLTTTEIKQDAEILISDNRDLCVCIFKIHKKSSNAKSKRKYSWIFRYYDVLNGRICYRLHRSLTVDDVYFLASEFRQANINYRLGIFKLRFYKRNVSE